MIQSIREGGANRCSDLALDLSSSGIFTPSHQLRPNFFAILVNARVFYAP